MPISPLNRVLLLLLSGLLLVLVGLWTIPVDEDWSNVAAIAPVESGPVAIKAAPAPSVTENLANRPIFDPSRHAALAMATQVPSAASAPPPTLVLAGLLVGSGKRVALIRTPDQKDLVLAHEGDTVSSWLIKEIASDHVVISSNGESQELRFPEKGPPGGVPGMPNMGTVTAPGVHTY